RGGVGLSAGAGACQFRPRLGLRAVAVLPHLDRHLGRDPDRSHRADRPRRGRTCTRRGVGMTKPRFDTILITGAAGRLGTELRRGLAPLARRLRLTDRTGIADLQPNEDATVADLADFDAMRKLCQGVDAIVHFGGAPNEQPWAEILD